MQKKDWMRLRPEKMKRLLRTALHIVLFSVAIAYIAGIFILRGRFMDRTSVNGVDVSHMTAAEAETAYRVTYEDWKLNVRTIEGETEVIDGDEIGFALAMDPSFPAMVRRQNFLKWPLTPYVDTSIKSTGSAVFDAGKLKKAIDGLRAMTREDVRDPVDAHIGRAEEGYYAIIEADDGNRLNPGRTYSAISQAITEGATEIDLDAAGCYEKASVYADDEALNEAFAPIDQFQQTVISINMEGGVIEPLTKEIYGSWLSFDPDTGEISVDADAAYAYGVSLYDKYSTFGHKRKFRAHAGDIVEVGGSDYDNFGYEMDLETTAAAIKDALMTGQSQEVSCTWIQYGGPRDELGGDFGDTYIEISLDEQQMWYYLEGEIIVGTSVVTGLATETRATPCGCFQVLDKLRDHQMQGSYGQAFSNYVIAIMFNGICIHDSSWRDDYGRDIWLYDGSHGCINTPYNAVKTIYENTWDGVPVVIYDRANTVPYVHNELYSGTDQEISDDYEEAHDDN